MLKSVCYTTHIYFILSSLLNLRCPKTVCMKSSCFQQCAKFFLFKSQRSYYHDWILYYFLFLFLFIFWGERGGGEEEYQSLKPRFLKESKIVQLISLKPWERWRKYYIKYIIKLFPVYYKLYKKLTIDK